MSDKFTTQAEAVAFLESMPALDIPHCGPNGYPCQECESLRAEVERLTTECIDKEHELGQLSCRILGMESRVRDAEQKASCMECRAGNMQATAAGYEADIEQLSAEVERLKAEPAALKPAPPTCGECGARVCLTCDRKGLHPVPCPECGMGWSACFPTCRECGTEMHQEASADGPRLFCPGCGCKP